MKFLELPSGRLLDIDSVNRIDIEVVCSGWGDSSDERYIVEFKVGKSIVIYGADYEFLKKKLLDEGCVMGGVNQ